MGDLVLVTGGAGYVGSHLVDQLLSEGYRVRVLDSLIYGSRGLAGRVDDPRLELVVGDICDPNALSRALRDVRRVVALAAIVGDAACDLDRSRTRAVNLESTRSLIDAARRSGVERVVFASSCSVYGANGNAPLHEDSPLNPVSYYARTRIESEDMLRAAAGELEVVLLRLATVCGVSPRMRFDLMVNTMTTFATQRGEVRVMGAGQWRPHVHVRDAARAFLLAATSPVESGRVYNVGTDEQNFTIGDVAEKVAERVPGTVLRHEDAVGDMRSYRVSFERIRRELGFTGTWTVDDAIHEVYDLLHDGRIEDPQQLVYHNARWLQRMNARPGAAA